MMDKDFKEVVDPPPSEKFAVDKLSKLLVGVVVIVISIAAIRSRVKTKLVEINNDYIKRISEVKQSQEELQSILVEVTKKLDKLEEESEDVHDNYSEILERMNKVEDSIKLLNSKKSSDTTVAKKSKDAEVTDIAKKPQAPTRGSKLATKKLISDNFQLTGYCNCSKCCGKWAGGPTKSGAYPQEGVTIAVDPNIIPLGSTVYIEGYGYRVAQDTGSAIKGNIIDIYYNDHSKAWSVGRQKSVSVYLVD